MPSVNFVRVGRVVRTLRRSRGWRQVDLAARADCSQQLISTIECGGGSRVAVRTLSRVAQALQAELDITVRWRGGQLERLLDEGHAALVARAADLLAAVGWVVQLEVSYETPRAAGAIDILAFHPPARVLLVVEVKTELLSAEATLRRHDEKVRLAEVIARDRLSWDALTVSALLVVPRSTTIWRTLERRSDLFARAYPQRGRGVSEWLRAPFGHMRGVWTISPTTQGGARTALTSRRRVHRLSARSD